VNTDYLIILIFLVFLAFFYTYIGLKFIRTARKRKGLTPFFVLGIFIGIIGGFAVFYNLKIMENALYFTIQYKRWWYLTVASIIFGGVLSIVIYLKVTKK